VKFEGDLRALLADIEAMVAALSEAGGSLPSENDVIEKFGVGRKRGFRILRIMEQLDLIGLRRFGNGEKVSLLDGWSDRLEAWKRDSSSFGAAIEGIPEGLLDKPRGNSRQIVAAGPAIPPGGSLFESKFTSSRSGLLNISFSFDYLDMHKTRKIKIMRNGIEFDLVVSPVTGREYYQQIVAQAGELIDLSSVSGASLGHLSSHFSSH